MDKNVHLTDKNERTRKIYRVKMMPGKQRHLKAKEEQSSFSASQPLSSKLPEDKKHNTQMQFSTYQKKLKSTKKSKPIYKLISKPLNGRLLYLIKAKIQQHRLIVWRKKQQQGLKTS